MITAFWYVISCIMTDCYSVKEYTAALFGPRVMQNNASCFRQSIVFQRLNLFLPSGGNVRWHLLSYVCQKDSVSVNGSVIMIGYF
jgi:hypothetical protein